MERAEAAYQAARPELGRMQAQFPRDEQPPSRAERIWDAAMATYQFESEARGYGLRILEGHAPDPAWHQGFDRRWDPLPAEDRSYATLYWPKVVEYLQSAADFGEALRDFLSDFPPD